MSGVRYNTLAYLSLTQWLFTGFSMKSKFQVMAHAKIFVRIWLMDPSMEWFPNPEICSCEQMKPWLGDCLNFVGA